jgi:CrcB protein
MTASAPRAPKAPVMAVVAVGGAVGAVARHLLDSHSPVADPWTTLAINVAGSFLLALLPGMAVVRRHALLPPALGPGLLGGFTTLSAYSEQSRVLVADGRPAVAATYVVGTLVACLLAVALAGRFNAPEEDARLESEEGHR